MSQLTGQSIIGFSRGTSDAGAFHGVNPSTGEELNPTYYSAGADEVDAAAQLAHKAFEIYGRVTGKEKAAFLRKIAKNIEALGDELVTRVTAETALPAARIKNELARTCNQLCLFADMVEAGSWVDARIDRADPARTPLPKPDVRSMLQPLGPIVVFCASNFPLAFSVAGGDTASALAAGNPVIVKAHHAHPGTAELVGLALSDAVRSCDLPEGVFSLVYGPGSEVGAKLVQHPSIKAGGFTGSRAGGLALLKLASTRPEPIPFYAEMSSVNPVFVLPSSLPARTEEIAKGLHGSVTLGAGQFCTNPGLVFIPEEGSEDLVKRLGALMSATHPFTMLTPGICSAYYNGVDALRQNSRVELVAFQEIGKANQKNFPLSAGGEGARGRGAAGDQPHTLPLPTSGEGSNEIQSTDVLSAGAALFQAEAKSFLKDPSLSAEVFGPSTLLIKYSSLDELLKIARSLEGQLTATIHGSDEELKSHRDLVAVLETKAGRLVFNGFPTGVEVGHAMVHGGPFPATADGRSTSVGTRAALRFVRQVCYQDFADNALPDELKDANPLKIWRMVGGEIRKDAAITE